MRLVLMDRWGAQKGTVSGLRSATWVDELNGEDSLSFEAATPVAKGDRVVWADAQGLWHEHVVAEVAQRHAAGGVTYAATCENSICELYGDFVEDRQPRDATASSALAGVLAATRWEVGDVAVAGTRSARFYRTSAREALQDLVEKWGGELSATIEVSGCEVTGRKVNLTRRGSDNGRRFTYSRDMAEVSRTFTADDVVTAMYGFGKGEEVGDGYGRGIDFASINGGKAYVEDADALKRWGRPDGRGGLAHVFGKFEDSECEDPAELLRETREALAASCEPKVSYEASVLALSSYGYDFSGVAVGDDVALVDTALSPEVRVRGRVTRLARDVLDGGRVTEVTLGNVVEGLDSALAGQYADLKALRDRATAWDVAASTPGAYIQQVMDGLNAKFDEGSSYVYVSPEMGIVVGSVPLDQATGLPTRQPASAMQLCGSGLRIASSLKGDGSWDWRTFGTGEGFVADMITAGVIRGGANWWNLGTGDLRFLQGEISDAEHDNYWNLTSGEFHLGQKAIKDSNLATADAAVRSVDVEYAAGDSSEAAPEGGWQTSSPAWEAGRYIWARTRVEAADGTVGYSEPACIQGAAGPAGRDGADGLPGRDGRDGADGASSYVHIRYSDVESPTDGQMTEAPGPYIGVCVDSQPQDPATASSYTWSRWAGEDGADGIPGAPGADGKSSYVHFAYAASADGAQGFSVTPFEGATHVGVRADSSQADPTDPAGYAWSLFKGADGGDGTGVAGIAEQYYLSTSADAPEGGGWSAEQPAWEAGRWIWTRSEVTWTDGTVTATAPVLARALTQASEAVGDLDAALDQEGVFDRLTNSGALKGLYMQDGQLYVNATYIKTGELSADLIKAGVLADAQGRFSLDLATGTITITSGTIRGEDVSDIASLLAAFAFGPDGMTVSGGSGKYRTTYGSSGFVIEDSSGASVLRVFVAGSKVYVMPAAAYDLVLQGGSSDSCLVVGDSIEFSAAPGQALTRTDEYIGTGCYYAWTRLYSSSYGQSGTITLSPSAENFALLLIIYNESNGNQHSTIAFKGGRANSSSSSATYANLSASYINSAGARTDSRIVNVQGTQISTYANNGYYSGHTYTAIGQNQYTGSALNSGGSDDIRIIAVYGLQT